MPEEESRQNEQRAKIDFKTLELEIDREIDSLFVPTINRAGRANREAEADDSSQFNPDRDKGPSAPGLGARVNLDALQVEIEKEIDSLLVPAARANWDAGPARTGGQEQPEKMESKPPAFDDVQKYHLQELSGLIELFNAAYLSLDWEFSRKNIEKFIAALSRLEPFASRSSEAKSVFRILDVILKRLHDRPHAVNSMLVQLIRDSHGLLAHMLLMDGNTGSHEKQRLKDLIERFQELRQRALAVKAGAKRPALSPDTRAEVQAMVPKGPEPVAETPRVSEKTDSARPPSRVRRENLCLMVSWGKCLALPASCILRVARSTGRRRLRILRRGYATLADFKTLFRGVRSGVMGEWAELPAIELKSYRFEPLDPYRPDDVDTGAPMAVLASDGQTHTIIFCEIVNFIADAEISTGPPTGETLGPFESKSHLLAPVFDPPLAGSSAQISIGHSSARRTAARLSSKSATVGE
jgi:hypothetical protein